MHPENPLILNPQRLGNVMFSGKIMFRAKSKSNPDCAQRLLLMKECKYDLRGVCKQKI